MAEYIRHMFTMESPRGKLLIQMQKNIAFKVQIPLHFIVLDSLPINAVNYLVVKGMN